MRLLAFRRRWLSTALAVLLFVGLFVLAWRVPSVRLPALLILGGLTFVVFVAACVLVVPAWLVARDTTVSTLEPEQLANAKNSVRTTLIQGLVGLTALVGIAVAWQQLQADRDQWQTDRQQLQEQLTLTRQGQVAERFTRAVEQLGSDKVDVRLGGIYGLEQIAKQSSKDRLQVFEVLSAYVRHHARGDPKRPQPLELQARAPDVQAAVTVLGRRDVSTSDPPLDLHGADLRRADLNAANLQGRTSRRPTCRGRPSMTLSCRGRTSTTRISTAPTSRGRRRTGRRSGRPGSIRVRPRSRGNT